MLGITPNEATLIGAFGGAALGAVVGGVVSFFTTRYMVKHGPDYSAQIAGMNEALAAIAATQEEMRKQHALAAEAETKRHQEVANQAEAARWKPTVKVLSTIQGSAQVNLLRLESLQEFALLEAGLLSSSGAKIADYLENGPKVRSTSFSVPITHETLVKIANTSQSYFQTSSFDATVRFVVQCAGHLGTYSADVPIHAEMDDRRKYALLQADGIGVDFTIEVPSCLCRARVMRRALLEKILGESLCAEVGLR